MRRGWGLAGAVFGAALGSSGALAQYLSPPDAPPPLPPLPPSSVQPQLPAEAPELKAPPSPIISVRNRTTLSACRKLGGISALAPVAGQTGLPAYELVLVEMKEKTLDAGGTHLLLIETTSGTVNAKGVGEAYSCPPGKGPAAIIPKH